MKHLVGRGDYLTACGLTLVSPQELTARLSDVTHDGCRSAIIARGQCPECGGTETSWGFTASGPEYAGPASSFYLGCDGCHATLLNHVMPAVVANALTDAGWRP